MAKFFLLWELDRTRLPGTTQEIGVGWKMLLDLVNEDLEMGRMKDWGSFAAELKGYCIMEGTEVEMMQTTARYAPYVVFEPHAVASVPQVSDVISSMIG
jgi:hypothetical protein